MLNDPEPDKRHAGSGSRRRALLFALILACFAFVSVYVVVSLTADSLDKEIAKLQAASLPTTAEDLEKLYEYPPPDKDTTELWLEAAQLLDNNEYHEATSEFWDLLLDAHEAPSPGSPWKALPKAEEALKQHGRPLELLHHAAELGGAARFPLDFANADYETVFGLMHSRSCLGLPLIEAHVRAHRGDASGTAQSIRVVFALGNALEKEPLLISQALKLFVCDRACEHISVLMPYVDFSDRDLADLRSRVAAIDCDKTLKFALVGERAWILNILTNHDRIMPDDFPKELSQPALQVRYLRLLNEYVAAADMAYPHRLDEAERIDREMKGHGADDDDTSIPIGNSFTGVAIRQVTFDATDVALAAEQFRRKKGRPPKTLDELMPEFLKKVPIDPFDGKPLRYVVRDREYVIYSVGKDRVDDGGRCITEMDEDGFQLDNPDIVIRVERK